MIHYKNTFQPKKVDIYFSRSNKLRKSLAINCHQVHITLDSGGKIQKVWAEGTFKQLHGQVLDGKLIRLISKVSKYSLKKSSEGVTTRRIIDEQVLHSCKQTRGLEITVS